MHIITSSFDNRLNKDEKYVYESHEVNLSISSVLRDYLIPNQTFPSQSSRAATNTSSEFVNQVSEQPSNFIKHNLATQNRDVQKIIENIYTIRKHLKSFDEACDGALIKLSRSIKFMEGCRDACQLQDLDEMIAKRDLLASQKKSQNTGGSKTEERNV